MRELGAREPAREPQVGGILPAVGGLLLALLAASAWIGLTALTGKTYHLAPPLVAAIPGVLVRSSGVRGSTRIRRTFAAALGIAAAGAGWGALEALDTLPSAALVPGGVRVEIAMGMLLGGAVGAAGLPVRLRSLVGEPRTPE